MIRAGDECERRKRLALLVEARRMWRAPASEEAAGLLRIQSAWCNAAIEGNPLTWGQVLGIARRETRAEDRHAREMLSCLCAAEFLEDAPEVMTLPLIRHLHALVMEGLGTGPGMLRDREVKIVKESGPEAGRAVFHPPHPARVRELLEDLLTTLDQDSEDPLLQAGRFHYEFQSIHPFEDGNGRVGRLLTTWLAGRGWDSAGFHLEPSIRRWGPGYYLALRAVRSDYEDQGAHGLDPWLLPFLDMSADALLNPPPLE